MAHIISQLSINTHKSHIFTINKHQLFQEQQTRQKMTMLESHVEALAFNYVSFGIFIVVNNLWTWIAVVTAAFSLWRIRAAAAAAAARSAAVNMCIKSDDVTHAPPHAKQSCFDKMPQVSKEPPRIVTSPNVAMQSKTTLSSPILDMEGSTRGKFAMYYYEEDCCMESEEKATSLTGECEDGYGDVGEWWAKWEDVLRVRTGEVEWYSHQDLSLINGNVVRLWDGYSSSRRSESSNSCAVF